MVKRILKIIGISLACFAVVAGASFGIFAIAGGFEEEKILMSRLYFANENNDVNVTTREYYTLTDITERLVFTPDDATETMLDVEFGGDKGVISNHFDTIRAGEEFTLHIAKDANGNNKSGVAIITFSNGINKATLTVLVDSPVKDNSIYFAGNLNDDNQTPSNSQITTLGKKFSMGMSPKTQYVYLRSNLTNAFELKKGNENLKNIEIIYNFYGEDGKKDSNLSGKLNGKSLNIKYLNGNSYYEIPMNLSNPGKLELTARVHKTYEIQKAYEEGNFKDIYDYYNNPLKGKDGLTGRLKEYSEFVNKYIAYFDTTDVSYAFFKTCSQNIDGKVTVGEHQFLECEKFVFSEATSTINVKGVSLNDIVLNKTDTNEFKVLSTHNFSVKDVSGISCEDIVDKFGISLTLTDDTIANAEVEMSNLFDTLTVEPYIYLPFVDGNISDEWTEYTTRIDVYNFDGNTPILAGEGDPIGCLVHLVIPGKTGTSEEYINIEKCSGEQDGRNYWRINFNAPMLETVDDKSLYLQFSATGIDLDTNQPVVKYAYSRIAIKYNNYEYNSQGQAVLQLKQYNKDEDDQVTLTDIQDMVLNTSEVVVTTNMNDDGYVNAGYVSNRQQIVWDKSNIENLDKGPEEERVEFTNVMYFVEKNSNNVNGVKKVATIGEYNFYSLTNNKYIEYKTADSPADEESYLVGERLPVDKDGNAYIQTLNASESPVKIFAVVYLSNKEGAPIQLNGRKISINEVVSDEEGDEEATTPVIYVVAQTNIDANENLNKMTSIKIDYFAEKINYYTKVGDITDVLVEYDGKEVFSASTGNYLKRNVFAEYAGVPELGLSDADKLELYNEIELYTSMKFLKGKDMVVYATNFELDASGGIQTVDKQKRPLDVLVYKNGILATENLSYDVDTNNNDSIAFKNMTSSNIDDHYELSLGNDFTITPVVSTTDNPIPDIPQNTIQFTIIIGETAVINDSNIMRLQPKKSSGTKSTVYSKALIDQGQDITHNRVTVHLYEVEVEEATLDTTSGLNRIEGIQAKYADISSVGDKGSLSFMGSSGEYSITLSDVKYNSKTTVIVAGEQVDRNYVDLSYGYSDIQGLITDSSNTNDITTEYIVPDKILKASSDINVGTFELSQYDYLPYIPDTSKVGYVGYVIHNDTKYYVTTNNQLQIDSTLIGGEKFTIEDSGFNQYIKTDKNKHGVTIDDDKAYVNFIKGHVDGKKVYLLIALKCNRNIDGEEIEVVNYYPIEYTITQNEIILSGTITTNPDNLINSPDNRENIINTQNINNGHSKALEIFLENSTDSDSGNSQILIDGEDAEVFIKHCNISLESGSDLINLRYDEVNNKLVIDFNKLPAGQSPYQGGNSIIITYDYQGQQKVFRYYFNVQSTTAIMRNGGGILNSEDNKQQIVNTATEGNPYYFTIKVTTDQSTSDPAILMVGNVTSQFENTYNVAFDGPQPTGVSIEETDGKVTLKFEEVSGQIYHGNITLNITYNFGGIAHTLKYYIEVYDVSLRVYNSGREINTDSSRAEIINRQTQYLETTYTLNVLYNASSTEPSIVFSGDAESVMESLKNATFEFENAIGGQVELETVKDSNDVPTVIKIKFKKLTSGLTAYAGENAIKITYESNGVTFEKYFYINVKTPA